MLKWSSRVGALKSLLYTSSSSSCRRRTCLLSLQVSSKCQQLAEVGESHQKPILLLCWGLPQCLQSINLLPKVGDMCLVPQA